MNFEEFKEKLMEDLKQALYEQTGEEYSVYVSTVNKLQNESYEAFTVKAEGSQIGVNINVQALFEAYEEGRSYEEVFDGTFRMVSDSVSQPPDFNLNEFTNYEIMKEKLSIQVVATERNAEILEGIPHMEVEDMSLVCRFLVEAGAYENGTILVTNSMLENYGISKEQLFEDALKSAPEIKPSEIRSMADVLAEIMEIDVSEFEGQMGLSMDDEIPMYVASTKDRTNGAGIIAYPGFFDMAAEKVGGDFFVLPSSVHEVIIVPDDGTKDFRVLEDMVKEVNAAQVDLKDQLSDHVYHYDSKDKVFELAEKFEARAKDKAVEKGSVRKELSDKKKETAEKPKEKQPKAPKKEETSL